MHLSTASMAPSRSRHQLLVGHNVSGAVKGTCLLYNIQKDFGNNGSLCAIIVSCYSGLACMYKDHTTGMAGKTEL